MKSEIRVQVAPSGVKDHPYEVRLIGPYGWKSIMRSGKIEALGEAESVAYILGVTVEFIK